MVVAVDYLLPIYKEVNTYPYLLDEHISGNPEAEGTRLSCMRKPGTIVSRHYKKQQEADKTSFQQAMAQNKASADVHEIVPAAINGRVEVLYVNKDYHTYGRFDEKRTPYHSRKRRTDSKELLGIAAIQTYLQGGVVQLRAYGNALPTANPNAVFRY